MKNLEQKPKNSELVKKSRPHKSVKESSKMLAPRDENSSQYSYHPPKASIVLVPEFWEISPKFRTTIEVDLFGNEAKDPAFYYVPEYSLAGTCRKLFQIKLEEGSSYPKPVVMKNNLEKSIFTKFSNPSDVESSMTHYDRYSWASSKRRKSSRKNVQAFSFISNVCSSHGDDSECTSTSTNQESEGSECHAPVKREFMKMLAFSPIDVPSSPTLARLETKRILSQQPTTTANNPNEQQKSKDQESQISCELGKDSFAHKFVQVLGTNSLNPMESLQFAMGFESHLSNFLATQSIQVKGTADFKGQRTIIEESFLKCIQNTKKKYPPSPRYYSTYRERLQHTAKELTSDSKKQLFALKSFAMLLEEVVTSLQKACGVQKRRRPMSLPNSTSAPPPIVEPGREPEEQKPRDILAVWNGMQVLIAPPPNSGNSFNSRRKSSNEVINAKGPPILSGAEIVRRMFNWKDFKEWD